MKNLIAFTFISIFSISINFAQTYVVSTKVSTGKMKNNSDYISKSYKALKSGSGLEKFNSYNLKAIANCPHKAT